MISSGLPYVVTPYIFPYIVYPMVYPKVLSGSPQSAGQSHIPLWRSIALVSALAWSLGLPRALMVGPVALNWVVFQALGAGIIPAAAGWLTLWRTKGDLKSSLWAIAGASLVLFLLGLWAGR